MSRLLTYLRPPAGLGVMNANGENPGLCTCRFGSVKDVTRHITTLFTRPRNGATNVA